MMMPKTDRPTTVLDRLNALTEGVRLRMLRLLEQEELAVGEVARILQMPQSTVSRHLKVLAHGGWLVKRSAGTATLYRLVLDDLGAEERELWLAVRGQLHPTGEYEADDRRLRDALTARRTDSMSFFGRVAGEWDAYRHELFGERFTELALLNLIDARWSVADLGCGTGNVAELLAPVVSRVIAVDRSQPMLDAAGRRLEGSPFAERVELREGSLEALPIDDGEVDAVCCSLVLHHVDDPEAGLLEMARVLRADRGGGVALVIDMVPARAGGVPAHDGAPAPGIRSRACEAVDGGRGLRPASDGVSAR
jgi:DNA-binding transcriptional ArsR family regulator